MASLLASVFGGPLIILPHSFNQSIINEIESTAGFDIVLADTKTEINGRFNRLITNDIDIECDLNILSLAKLRDPDSVFLKLFTGGSTGKPKVWNKSPRNMFTEALYHSGSFNISSDDIFVSTVPPQHIYGLLYSVLIPFVSSARVGGEIYTFPQEIISAVVGLGSTVLVSVPMHYRVLNGADFVFDTLKLAISSGGKLDSSDARYFYDRTGIPVSEIFGSTETGGIAVRRNSGDEIPWEPLGGIDWKIDDDRLCVCSEFISADMRKDADGFFATEDRVEKAEGGLFRHVGRADGVVKVAGKRVDLKDIESRLKTIPGVRDAFVISIPASGGRENEIAAVIEGDTDKSSVRRKAKEILEPQAIPRKIKVVDKMPLVSTGKYDRQRILSIFKPR
jgi:acyl-coenzyme A synthetase/AMP-(fatty) acid ligase